MELPLVSITIDDGWRSARDIAMPILERHKLPATFYVVSGRLPDSSYPAYINDRNVQEIHQAGHEIGAHTLSHSRLSELEDKPRREEILRSQTDLGGLLGSPIATFAYPYGDHNDAVVDHVKLAGFKGARLFNDGFSDLETDPFRLESKAVKAVTALDDVKQWVDHAIANNLWLILVFHQVDYGGREYSTTPEIFDGILAYLRQLNVRVATVGSVLQEVN